MRGLTALAAIFTLAASAASPAFAQRAADLPQPSAVEALGASAAEEVKAQFRGPTRQAAQALSAPEAAAASAEAPAAPAPAAAPAP
ncbi:hypothetical protein, partial [Neomegalonema perideroedes]|uniref:hypothetical protein n=1 Tax=Neomegalonema perideroedes TaxID=217219 RepID=UPI00036E46D1